VVVSPSFAHIVKSNSVSNAEQKYAIYDADPVGNEESGFAQPVPQLTRQEAGRWLALEGIPRPEIDGLLQEVDREGHASVRLKRPMIVRSWFDIVFNPLIESLETELALVRKGNWTWRFRPPSLELVRPVRRYLEPTAVASLEQICRLVPETQEVIQSHDNCVDKLFKCAANLHNALTTARTFIVLCDTLWEPSALSAAGIQGVQEIFGGYVPEERYDLMAQYIVNNTADLPGYYSTSKFWNRHRTALMETLHHPEINPHYERLLQAGQHLGEVTEGLSRRLGDLRRVLSLDHDVPYVAGSPASAVSRS
jgi:hypothetical protein